MLDLSTIKVVQKGWGTQIWLNDYELLLVMQAGGRTSLHRHEHHGSTLQILSGKADLRVGHDYRCPLTEVDADPGTLHQIIAIEDCVIYEKYSPDLMLPEEDIERLPC